ncbi:hypothetical protein AB0N06_18815 [Streptomyces sp. NPDC051020]
MTDGDTGHPVASPLLDEQQCAPGLPAPDAARGTIDVPIVLS